MDVLFNPNERIALLLLSHASVWFRRTELDGQVVQEIHTEMLQIPVKHLPQEWQLQILEGIDDLYKRGVLKEEESFESMASPAQKLVRVSLR